MNGNMNDFYEKYINSPDESFQYDTQDIQDNKIWAVLSYVSILFILPLLVNDGKSRYGRYHANQGFILFLTELVAGLANLAIGWIPFLGSVIKTILSLIIIALMAYGIFNAANGKVKRLPFVGQLFDIFNR
ncbi:MAG: hypothetical protein LUF89_12425 [Ruminococcus sp.]|nr:hypothetical protein [Ruminococcus sp.]